MGVPRVAILTIQAACLAAFAAMGLAALSAGAPSSVSARFACPVTTPNDSRPPPGGGGLGPGSFSIHGNGLLWTILPDNGVWVVPESGIRSDGSIRQKFVWWRRVIDQTIMTGSDGLLAVELVFAGELRITGRRLDADVAPATATTRPDGVHVGSTITFPSGGCWEITGAAGDDRLTFTVYMLRPNEPMPSTAVGSLTAGSLHATILGVVLFLAGTALAVRYQVGAKPSP